MTESRYHSAKVKKLNKKLILSAIQLKEDVSRAELSRITGLVSSSITRLTRELLEEGYIIESELLPKKTPGRNGIGLRLNPNKWKSLSFDVGVSETIVGVGFFDRSVKVITSFHTPPEPTEFFKKAREIYETLDPEYGFSIVVFSIPGMCDMKKNIILLAPNLGWKGIEVSHLFSLDTPVIIDNEANLSILAEYSRADDLKNLSNAVFVIIREGVGTGIMINKEIYRGFTFTAGEAGHMTINFNTKKECHCGNSGCWELYSSIRWPLKEYPGKLRGKTPIEKFRELILKKDAGEILKRFAHNIGIGIANITNILNPELIILGGEITNMPDEFYKEITNTVKRRAVKYAVESLKIRPSIFKEKSSNLVGAAITGIERLIELSFSE